MCVELIRGMGPLEAELRRIEAMLAVEPSRMSSALLPIARGQIEIQLAWVLHQLGGGAHEARARIERALDLLPMDQYQHRGAAGGVDSHLRALIGAGDDEGFVAFTRVACRVCGACILPRRVRVCAGNRLRFHSAHSPEIVVSDYKVDGDRRTFFSSQRGGAIAHGKSLPFQVARLLEDRFGSLGRIQRFLCPACL